MHLQDPPDQLMVVGSHWMRVGVSILTCAQVRLARHTWMTAVSSIVKTKLTEE